MSAGELDVLIHANMTDGALLETLRRMVATPAAYSESARRSVIGEVRRRRLDQDPRP